MAKKQRKSRSAKAQRNPKVVRVIAIKPGFDAVQVAVGEEFDYVPGPKGLPSWLVPATPENREKFGSEIPVSHPKLDEDGVAFPYSAPSTGLRFGREAAPAPVKKQRAKARKAKAKAAAPKPISEEDV